MQQRLAEQEQRHGSKMQRDVLWTRYRRVKAISIPLVGINHLVERMKLWIMVSMGSEIRVNPLGIDLHTEQIDHG